MNGRIVSSRRFPSPNPNVTLSTVTYFSDGLKVKGLLAEPIEDGSFEGLLYLRGGIKNQGKVRPARVAQFAQEGLIVFAPFYRGNQGGEGAEDFCGMDRFDAYHGFELLKKHSRVKEKRVHLFGFSRGGLMALWTAINYPEATSIVTWGGVSDLFLTYEERKDLRKMLKRVIGGSPYSKPELYRMRTPLDEIQHLQSSLLIIHGKQDRNVSFEHALKLERCAKMYQKQVETWYFDEFTHYFPPKENRKITEAAVEWMKNQ
ncbi:alpha/beta hydrolase family protein [Fervidibacillus albus]|uniref:Prolyl oligopeptidase family serine peptidase n=1 Tax=Fervidibacillus albus TaxID=2980026 RepID=A0A9E8LVG6_9BACI|nr:prolyl oligopeptidase family serine peptidase [Fervidibacillus albus]WAA10055.1 prolyl oligopeptidase family serine peptidase [Fervidibacillus albus]